MNSKVIILCVLFLSISPLAFSQCEEETFHGEGTFYQYEGGGNCSYPTPEYPAMIGAMNATQYNNSGLCGACVEVTGPKGSVMLRIEDQCPECKPGDIDFAEEAFPSIAEPIDGRVPISWNIVPCPVTGPIQFYFKEGSNQWWTAVQIRNHKYPIASVEYKKNGVWTNITRMEYNYFLDDSGFGNGPFDFRVTDIKGNVIEETNIPFKETTIINGTQQFPDCITEETQNIELKTGWNLVTLSLDPADKQTSSVFPNASIVKTFDDFFKKDNEHNSLTELTPGNAYLVYNDVAETVTITGTKLTSPTTELKTGWNLVGYPLLEESNIDQKLQPIIDNVEIVKTFSGYWENTAPLNSIEVFQSGEGYFVKVTADCTINW